MLIQFHPDGSIDHTRNPALENIFKGYDKTVQRMTEIEFSYLDQRYYIKFLRGEFADLILSWEGQGLARAEALSGLFREYVDNTRTIAMGRYGHVLFGTYEAAVAVEVGFVDFLRFLGFDFNTTAA